MREIEEHLLDKDPYIDMCELIEEYADALMCLFDSAGRMGILPKHIFDGFEKKLAKNKKRKWKKNADDTYSHISPSKTDSNE